VIERLAVEARWRKNLIHMELAEKAAGFGTWDVDYANNTITISPGAAALTFGARAKSSGMLQLKIDEFMNRIDPEHRDRILAESQRMMAGDQETQAEYRVTLADGSVRWQRSRGRAYFVDGKPARVIGALIRIDITAEREMIAAKERAVATDDMYQRVSHGTESTALIARELLSAERCGSLQSSVVCPAIVFVEQVNVILRHGRPLALAM
jgi:PAS fold